MGLHQMYGSGGQLNEDAGYGLLVGAWSMRTPRLGLMISQHGRLRRRLRPRGARPDNVTLELGVDAQRWKPDAGRR